MRSHFAIALFAAFALACTSGSEDPAARSTDAPSNDSAETADVAPAETTESQPMPATAAGMYALSTTTLAGEAVDLSQYAGQVTLVVNVASECGYTPQYEGLQALHAELSGKGFAVLGFPSNEFGGQEPGSSEQIQEFCSSKFGVSFPMFGKCEVKSGGGQSPVYGYLSKQTGDEPNWNFCKYLVGKDGEVIGFYPSAVAPDAAELRAAIDGALE